MRSALVFLLLSAASISVAYPPIPKNNANFIKGWGALEAPNGISAKDAEGVLTVTVPKNFHADGKEISAKIVTPRVMQTVRGDFSVQVSIKAFAVPLANSLPEGKKLYRSAGLLLYKDDKNYIRFERGGAASYANPTLTIDYIRNGVRVSTGNKALEDGDVVLRIVRKDKKLSFYFVDDPDDPEEEFDGKQAVLEGELSVGVSAINSTGEPFEAVFEKFKLAEEKK